MAHGIGWAVKELYNRNEVRRTAWPEGMYLYLQLPGDHSGRTLPSVFMRMELNGREELVAWTCSQNDLLATDWEVID